MAREAYINAQGSYPILMNSFISGMFQSGAIPFQQSNMLSAIQSAPTLFPLSVYDQTALTKGALATYYRSFEIGLINWLAAVRIKIESSFEFESEPN